MDYTPKESELGAYDDSMATTLSSFSVNYDSYFDRIIKLTVESIVTINLTSNLNMVSFSGTDPKSILQDYINCVGALFEMDGETKLFLGTATVIGVNIIISARHCVNGTALEDLRFSIDDKNFYSLSLIEDGALVEKDYILLKADPNSAEKQNDLTNFIPLSSELPTNEHILAIGMQQVNGELSKYAGMCEIKGEEYELLEQLTKFDSTYGFSGAPYIRGDGKMVGLHLKSEQLAMFTGQKSGLSFHPICDEKKVSLKLYNYIINPNMIPDTEVELFNDFFDDFSTTGSLGLQADEGKKRKHIFSNTPTLTSKVGKKVLKRWEDKKKAIYKGTKSEEQGKYRDIANWKVSVIKVVGDPRVAVALNTKRDDTGKAAIQMGHKLSCSSYWNKGNQEYIREEKKRLQGKYPEGTVRSEKIEKLNQRCADYKEPFKEIYKNLYHNNYKQYLAYRKKFMLNDKNYRFEWYFLNEKNGRQEEAHAAPPGFEWKNDKLCKA